MKVTKCNCETSNLQKQHSEGQRLKAMLHEAAIFPAIWKAMMTNELKKIALQVALDSLHTAACLATLRKVEDTVKTRK